VCTNALRPGVGERPLGVGISVRVVFGRGDASSMGALTGQIALAVAYLVAGCVSLRPGAAFVSLRGSKM